ncbi:RICIN domain-containing protein [Saccharothrix deserti]|uniref:RICIN domain-containing protein n=1 Tax=Saccharothrix deserti TaxID=2593674 RepID=UPI00131ACD40|nr:RICIN domain-containing protein [Saccharothrix deserti]
MRFPYRRAILAAVVTLGAAVVVPSTSANAATPVSGTTYQVSVTKSGKCLDMAAGSTVNGGLVQQWGCSGDKWQQFTLNSSGSGVFTLVNVNSGKCLDIPNGTTQSGVQLQQWSCSGASNQQWRLTASGSGTYQVINAASGLCLANKDASTDSGAPIIQESCTANTNKQWLFTPVGGRTWPSTADGFAGTGAGTTGGAGGTTVTVTTYADLVRYATASAPHVIRVDGTITVTPMGTEVRVASNKTIVGVGTRGQIVNGGFFLGAGVSNVIIRNLTIRDTRMADDDPGDDTYDYDAIQMDTANRIWIDHNHLARMNDGLIDSRKDNTNLTVSWNVLAENNKTFGIGWTDNVTSRITIHHNWFRSTNSRNPSGDNIAYAHMYNNYLQNTGSGNWSRGATKMVLENSYFENVKDPYYKDAAAELRQSGSIVVNSTGRQETGGSAFNPGSFYSYTLDPAANVPSLLRTYAGPQANIGT